VQNDIKPYQSSIIPYGIKSWYAAPSNVVEVLLIILENASAGGGGIGGAAAFHCNIYVSYIREFDSKK
jgi:hypothetical protein